MHYVIIGGSIAGIAAAKAIRGNNPGAEISMISEEKGAAYYRPMIPLLIEKEDAVITFEENPVKKYRIDIVYDKSTSLDIKAKEIVLSAGGKLHFDRLLIATGGSPVIPDIPGLKGKGAFTLRTAEDAVNIRAHTAGVREAVVLGAGLAGLKAAAAMQHIGLHVTIVEKFDQILYGRLDKQAARTVADAAENAGVSILTGRTVDEVERKDGIIKSLKLSSGEKIDAGIIVIAAGVKPNIDFLRNSGMTINKGIVVNDLLQTSLPDIYAAGDVVEYTDIVTGRPEVSGLWTNAEEMGRTAGRNMSGDKLKYSGFLSVMNSAELFGVPFISIGIVDPDEKGYEIATAENKRLIWKDDVLAGAVFVEDIEGAGIYTNLIRNRTPLGSLKEKALKGSLGYIEFLKSRGGREAAAG